MEDERMDEFQIDDFPNEILGMIFDRLPFADLLRASHVCGRWSAVVATFCSHRVLLRIRTNERVEMMSRFRHPKHVAINFELGFVLHRVMEWVRWLRDVASTLETLDITVGNLNLLEEVELTNLVELELSIGRYVELEMYDSEQVDLLNQFLGCLKRLKVAVICASTNLDQLKILDCGVVDYPPENSIRSLPMRLEALTLNELDVRDVSRLQMLFHNVLNLEIIQPISGECLHQIAISWPTLHRLSIKVTRLAGVTQDLRRLPDLRTLVLHHVGQRAFSLRSSFRLLNSLLRIRSLEMLVIFGHGDFSVPDRNPSCEIFLNDRQLCR
ncbi:uncharacterized protein LOC6042315 [Culex quinquefasciatus]|uniref:uncharacterized protein LOC6042315 n=1 Tax=Culex quinquefasciatus TaxID=7176 RepID=UPI0018E30C95|nr:uncharacterized protein LOC6042315 [Culex quinquefasciatus]